MIWDLGRSRPVGHWGHSGHFALVASLHSFGTMWDILQTVGKLVGPRARDQNRLWRLFEVLGPLKVPKQVSKTFMEASKAAFVLEG